MSFPSSTSVPTYTQGGHTGHWKDTYTHTHSSHFRFSGPLPNFLNPSSRLNAPSVLTAALIIIITLKYQDYFKWSISLPPPRIEGREKEKETGFITDDVPGVSWAPITHAPTSLSRPPWRWYCCPHFADQDVYINSKITTHISIIGSHDLTPSPMSGLWCHAASSPPGGNPALGFLVSPTRTTPCFTQSSCSTGQD